MNNAAPFNDSQKVKMGQGDLQQPKITQSMDLLSYLVKSTLTSGIEASEQFAPTSEFQDESQNLSLPVNEIHFLFQKQCFAGLILKCADAQAEEATNAMTEIIQHLSWNDRNVSQFFINELVDFIRLKQTVVQTATTNIVSFPPELDVAYQNAKRLVKSQGW